MINYNEKEYRIEFYDTAGQERYRAISLNSIKSADGIVLMYDITNQKSFDDISNWMKNIRQLQGNEFPMILVGNKCDLESKRIVTYEEGIELSKTYKIPFFEVSNKKGINIEESSLELIKQIRNKGQDEKLDEIAEGIKILKHEGEMAGIGIKEVGERTKKTGKDMDKTHERVKTQNERISELVNKIRSSDKICCDIVLILILLGLICVLYSIIKHKYLK